MAAGHKELIGALITWLRSDATLVTLTGDASGDRRILRAFPASPTAKYPALTAKIISHVPDLPLSDVEIQSFNKTVIDLSAWTGNAPLTAEVAAFNIMDRIEAMVRPSEATRAALDPRSNMTNASLTVYSYHVLSRLPVIFIEDYNSWNGTIAVEFKWRPN